MWLHSSACLVIQQVADAILYCVWERSNSFEHPTSSNVPIPLLNGRIFVCPTVGIKAGLTVIFGKVRTRCTIIRAVSLTSFVRISLSLFRTPPGNGSSAPPLGNSLRDPPSQRYIFLLFFALRRRRGKCLPRTCAD